LKLQYDEPLSNVAFKPNLRCYSKDEQGLLNPLAIMSENAERLTQSMAPPRTLDFLDKGIEAGLSPAPVSATFCRFS
jgi:hypothetical protein